MLLGSQRKCIDPLHIFLTSNAGCEKSFLTKALYWVGKKVISHKNTTLHKPQLLILAPTGVAAINVAGITMQTAMETFGKNLPETGNSETENYPKCIFYLTKKRTTKYTESSYATFG